MPKNKTHDKLAATKESKMAAIEYVLLFHDDYEVIKFDLKREAVEYLCQNQETNGEQYVNALFVEGDDVEFAEFDVATLPICIRLTHPTSENALKGEFTAFTPNDMIAIKKAFNKGKEKAIKEVKKRLVSDDAIRILHEEIEEKQAELKRIKKLLI